MKAILERRRFDTETAKKIAEWWNGVRFTDFGYIKESLYKTGSGAYFLHGEGGAKTKYAEQRGKMICNGGQICPLTADEAYQWLEEHGLTAEIEAEFPELLQEA